MNARVRTAILVIAILHVIFSIVEISLWETLTPILHIYDPTTAKTTAPVGRNVGIYNVFVAASLFWLYSARRLEARDQRSLATVLLVGVVVVGIFGSCTIDWKILLFQPLPALVALGMLMRSKLP